MMRGEQSDESTEKRDPYRLLLVALWLALPLMALRVWSAWNQLPPRMATHFDAQGRANGWSSREDAIRFTFALLGGTLVLLTPLCYWVRVSKPSHSWPVLVITYFAFGCICWAANSIVSQNL